MRSIVMRMECTTRSRWWPTRRRFTAPRTRVCTTTSSNFKPLRLNLHNDPDNNISAETPISSFRQCRHQSIGDAVDNRLISEVTSGTGQIVTITTPGSYDPYPTLTTAQRPANWDTDGDGIPDAWDILHGLNPNNPQTAMPLRLTDTPILEYYLNSIPTDITLTSNSVPEDYNPGRSSALLSTDDIAGRDVYLSLVSGSGAKQRRRLISLAAIHSKRLPTSTT